MQKNNPQPHKDSSEKDLIDDIIQKWQATTISENSYMGTEIIGRMVRMNAFIQQCVEENLSRYDLNAGDFDLLAVLRRETKEGLTPRRIQELILVSSGGLSNRMTRLEARELITRLPDPNDRRGVIVQLTEKGTTLIETVAPTHLTLENELVAKLSTDEQTALTLLLKKMLRTLEN